MLGDISDIVGRLKAALPTRWFPDETPVLDALLTGLSTPWSSLFTLLAVVRAQTRIATTTDGLLDGASADFFGPRLPRRNAEPDDPYRTRLHLELIRSRATRPALIAMLVDLTGRTPIVFEPSRPADTGAYGSPSLAYGVTGAWGSLKLPYQMFVTARRPAAAGIAAVAGYGTGGPLARAGLAELSGQVTDSDIYTAVTSVLPTAATAWTSITN